METIFLLKVLYVGWVPLGWVLGQVLDCRIRGVVTRPEGKQIQNAFPFSFWPKSAETEAEKIPANLEDSKENM